MNPRIPNMSVRKLSSAIAAATLMGIAGQASAVPVTLDVIYECDLPAVGVETIPATVNSDMPEEAYYGEENMLDAFALEAVTTINENIRSGLDLVYAASMEGKAIANARVITPGRVMNLSGIDLNVPNTEIPIMPGDFTLIASGETPAIGFRDYDVGTAEITVGNITLDMETYKANGDQLAGEVGDFEVDCVMVDENENPVEEQPILHTFEIKAPDCTGPDCDTDDPAEIAVSPESIDFGNTQAGGEPKTETVTVSNTGDLDLGINGITLGGDSEFSKSNDNCTTVAGGESCTFDITFAPGTEDDFTGNVTIESDAVNNDDLEPIGLSGKGELEPTPVLGLSTSSIDFGKITVGESAPETITITNDGTGVLSDINVGQVDGDSEFQTDDKCTGQSLAEGESCEVGVSFTPGAEGANYSASFDITSNGGGDTVTLAGTGDDNVVDPPVAIDLDLEGETFIARSEGTLPITGSIAALLYLEDFSIEADLALDPTVANFAIVKGWNSWASTAQVEFEQTRVTTGTLDSGKLKTSSEMYIYVPEVTAPVFGFEIKIGGGENCRTSEPSVIELESAEGEKFSPSTGGRVTGTYSLADLENCGWLTGLVNSYMAGPGNTLDLNLTVID